MVERTDKSDGCSTSARLAQIRRRQDEVEARYAAQQAERQERRRVAALPLTLVADDAALDRLAGMALDARRYRMSRILHRTVRAMGCRTMADVAALQRGRVDSWLGYAQADILRGLVLALVARLRAGHPEPGIWRIGEGLTPEIVAQLRGQPLDRLAGRGVRRDQLAGIAAIGILDLADLAAAELDTIEDVPGCGPATIARIQERIGLVVEALPQRVRRQGVDDDEWNAAAPERCGERGLSGDASRPTGCG